MLSAVFIITVILSKEVVMATGGLMDSVVSISLNHISTLVSLVRTSIT